MSLGILAAETLSNQGIATESACTTDEHDRRRSMTSRDLKCSESLSECSGQVFAIASTRSL